MFENYKNYYEWGLITKNDVAIAVALKEDGLTAEQYKTITGEDYVAPTVTSVITEIKEKISDNEFAINLTGAAVVDRIEDIEGKLNT